MRERKSWKATAISKKNYSLSSHVTIYKNLFYEHEMRSCTFKWNNFPTVNVSFRILGSRWLWWNLRVYNNNIAMKKKPSKKCILQKFVILSSSLLNDPTEGNISCEPQHCNPHNGCGFFSFLQKLACSLTECMSKMYIILSMIERNKNNSSNICGMPFLLPYG